MERLDAHVHHYNFGADPGDLIRKFEAAGIHGGNVFSAPPKQLSLARREATFEERLDDILKYTSKYPDRLFPILWIHPDEDGICEKVYMAAEKGIKGFKIICNNFFIYEKKGIKLLENIAAAGKPVMFHSGILWDGTVSSAYNRPMNWECCIEINKLKFSLAHCSWPWYDECIALYGKFLSAYGLRPDVSSEMFLDLTPGTPEPYRRDLLTKLHTVGYDIKHNLLFGTDGRADDYASEWASRWIGIDDAIYDDLKLDDDTRECIYGVNLMRFLGITDDNVAHRPQTPDGR